MKRLVLLSLVLIGFAAVTAATPVQCSVLLTPNEAGASTDPSVAAPIGFYISSLTLSGTDEFAGYRNNNPIVSFGGMLSLSTVLATPLGAPTFCDVVTSGVSSGARSWAWAYLLERSRNCKLQTLTETRC